MPQKDYEPAWTSKVVIPSINDFTLTLANYKDYLNSNNKEMKAQAQRIQYLLDKGYWTNEGKPNAKYFPGMDPDPAKSKQEARKALEQKYLDEKNAKDWAAYDEKAAANARNPQNPPNKNLKPPKTPRPKATPSAQDGTTNELDAFRYTAQTPKDAKGAAKTETTVVGKDKTTTTTTTAGTMSGTNNAKTGNGKTGTGNTGSTGNGNKNGSKDTTTTKPATAAEQQQALLEAAAKYYIPESFFSTDPELKKIFQDFVYGVKGRRDTEETFFKKLNNSTFKVRYSEQARQRLTQADQYEKLLKQANGNVEAVRYTPFARDIENVASRLGALAKNLGASPSPDELRLIAVDLWKSGLEGNDYAARAALRKYIKATVDPRTGMSTLTGNAAIGQQALSSTLRNNGFDPNMASSVFSDLLPAALSENPGMDPNQAVTTYILQQVADGASINDYTQKIRNAAAMGYNDNIKSLLQQGVDLSAVANPYIQAMGSVLEINPETLNVNDPTIRAALSGDKTLNLYDFTKALRKDDRWQYTQQARTEVSNAALQILRDFGFTG